MVAALLKILGFLLDPGLVRDGGPRVRRAAPPLGRILAAVAVHLVQLLGLAVPRLEVVVGQRPRRGDPVDVPQFPEVPRPQPVQGGAIQLGRSADEVVDLRLEGLAVGIEPRVLGDVPALREHRPGIPVVRFPGQEVPALEEENLLARSGEGVRERPSPGTRPNDDHVVVLSHGLLLLPPCEPASRLPGAACAVRCRRARPEHLVCTYWASSPGRGTTRGGRYWPG